MNGSRPFRTSPSPKKDVCKFANFHFFLFKPLFLVGKSLNFIGILSTFSNLYRIEWLF